MSRIAVVVALVLAGALAFAVARRWTGDDAPAGRGRGGPAPVEVAPIETGPIALRRTFSGTLEARSQAVVAADVGGRVQKLMVELANPVKNGQIVAELDDDEELQGVAEQRAEVAVSRANISDAESALDLAERELARLTELRRQGVVAETDLDQARATLAARKAAVDVARARSSRTAAALQRARIQSGYTRVRATWDGDTGERVVAVRHVSEGDSVRPGDPLFTVVSLEPMVAVVFATEREYGRLKEGQKAAITTDAYPDRVFTGEIKRIAPVFRETSRQARVEIELANTDHLLKPGMFIRAEVVLDRSEGTTIVPFVAITQRDGQTGVFVIDDSGNKAIWRAVRTGIRDGDRVEIHGEGIRGYVVTLGHQLISDGSDVSIPEAPPREAKAAGP